MNLNENEISGQSNRNNTTADVKDSLHLRRLYVAGFRSTDVAKSEILPTSSQLTQFFNGFGSIQNIEIYGSRNYKHDDINTNDHDDVNDTSMKKRKRHIRQPFAFVTFESKNSVDEILTNAKNDKNNADVYKMEPQVDVGISCNVIKRCYPKKEQPIKRHRKGHEEMQTTLENCSSGTNLIIQLHRSHLHRMMGYIETMNKAYERRNRIDDDSPPPPILVGSASPSSRSRVSFVFLRTEEFDAAQYWINYFSHHPILTRFALNKVYMADTLVTIPHNLADEKKAELLSCAALEKLTTSNQLLSKDAKANDVTLKVQVFPPKPFQRTVIASLDSQMDALEVCQASSPDGSGSSKLDDSSLSSIPTHLQTLANDPRLGILSMSTIDYTHTLSCVQLYCPLSNHNSKKSNKKEQSGNVPSDDRKELFMIGILPRKDIVEPCAQDKETDMDENDNSEICRAYYKLQEAMELYRADDEMQENEETAPLCFKGKTAFDCGSSPGGWTKYLVEKEGCAKVYSCDPGLLDPSVSALDQVMHLNMRGDDAMDWIVGKEGRDENNSTTGSNGVKDRVHLWVSDMCLLNPSHQVDHFLRALEKGVLATNTNQNCEGKRREGEWISFVLTLKFNTGHARETFDDMARLEVQRLKERLETWAVGRNSRMSSGYHGDTRMKEIVNVKTYHLFSNRKGERTIMGRLFV